MFLSTHGWTRQPARVDTRDDCSTRGAVMRVFVDCRQMPSESNCSLTIAGEETEVLRAAVMHAVDVHGHKESEELREGVRAAIAPEAVSSIYMDGSCSVTLGGNEEKSTSCIGDHDTGSSNFAVRSCRRLSTRANHSRRSPCCT